jgi:hypothetical protein
MDLILDVGVQLVCNFVCLNYVMVCIELSFL